MLIANLKGPRTPWEIVHLCGTDIPPPSGTLDMNGEGKLCAFALLFPTVCWDRLLLDPPGLMSWPLNCE